jgi:hypothetical protein
MTIRFEKLIAVLAVALAIASYYHYYFERCHALGRQGYLTYQASHFDMYLANPSWGYPLYAGLVVAVLLIILYEAVAAACGQLRKNNSKEN